MEVSGILTAHAANLVKISGDLRLLNLTGEIRLPAVQAGSSIMPGKVNPVIPEAVIQIGLRVMANDTGICNAVSRGTGQINEFLPLIADLFLEEIDLLGAASQVLAAHVSGIEADEERCRDIFDRSPMIVTALLPFVGYERAAALLQEFRSGGTNQPGGRPTKLIRSFLEEKLGKGLIEQALSPHQLTALGYRKHGHDAQG